MAHDITFYTRCMDNHSTYPGFIAQQVAIAGQGMKGCGEAITLVGDLCSTYGWAGSTLSALGFAGGKIAQMLGIDNEIASIAIFRFMETTSVLIFGKGLTVVGELLASDGRRLESRDNQCKVGNALDFGFLSESESPS